MWRKMLDALRRRSRANEYAEIEERPFYDQVRPSSPDLPPPRQEDAYEKLSMIERDSSGITNDEWKSMLNEKNEINTLRAQYSKEIRKEERDTIRENILEKANNIIGILDTALGLTTLQQNERICYLFLKGGSYAFIAEFTQGTEREAARKDANKAYKAAEEIANTGLSPADPLKLALDLEYSQFCANTLDDIGFARLIAKKALEEGKIELEMASQSLMQIEQQLRDWAVKETGSGMKTVLDSDQKPLLTEVITINTIVFRSGTDHRFDHAFQESIEENESSWETVSTYQPMAIEFGGYGSTRRFKELANQWTLEQLSSFFTRVECVTLLDSRLRVVELSLLLKRCPQTRCLTIKGNSRILDKDRQGVVKILTLLPLKAADLSFDWLWIIERLNVVLLKLSVAGLKIPYIDLSTIEVLVVSDIDYESIHDAEKLIESLLLVRLKCLVLEWNLLNVNLCVNQRTANLLEKLLTIFRKLDTFGIVCQTYCPQTKLTSNHLVKLLDQGLWDDVEYSNCGVEGNHAIIVGGSDPALRDKLKQIYCDSVPSSPCLQQLALLVDSTAYRYSEPVIFDIGGFGGVE